MTDPSRPTIAVWPFHETPLNYQTLSPHGGDEDWIIWAAPHAYGRGEHIADRLTICDQSTHDVEGGTVWITCHA